MTLARGTDQIESDRLMLRRMAPHDLDYFIELHTDPEVTRYIGHGLPRSTEETTDWLHHTFETYESFGLGQLAVIQKSDGRVIGRCGLSDFIVELRAAAGAVPRAWFRRSQAPAGAQLTYEQELGYTFERKSWGHGYAREAAGCVYRYARDVLRLPRIVSIIHPDNARSRKLAQGFGVQADGPVEVAERVCDLFVWPGN